jgi:hypothetical protein
MNYSNEIKPARILNLRSLQELNENFFLTKNNDNAYFNLKKAEYNAGRFVFSLETSNINVQPAIRQVICTHTKKRYNNYKSFVIEPKDKSTGIAVIMIKLDDPKSFYCNVRILPLSTLSDIAERDNDSILLTVNLEKAKFVLKTDITITPSNTGEPQYSVHDVDVSAISDLVTQSEMVELKRELEFQGSKLIAHYFQGILNIVANESGDNKNGQHEFPDDFILKLPSDQLKELLAANVIAGNISLEIVGSNVIKDLNRDWTAAGAFINYLL